MKNNSVSLLIKLKSLIGSIWINRYQTGYLGFLLAWTLFAANGAYKFGKDCFLAFNLSKYSEESHDAVEEHNNEIIKSLIDNTILVCDAPMSVEQRYYFSNNSLFDTEGNVITLDNVEMPVNFAFCNISNELFENIHLSTSKITSLSLDGCNIDNDFINYLPSTIEELSLDRCNYITDLSELPSKCPNITFLSIDSTPSLTDLSFIYELKKLKTISVLDSAYITDDLLKYLKDNNIETTLTNQEVLNSQIIDEIISNIITPDMTDREKIQAVCLYVLDNVEYDIRQTRESNLHPLSCVLEDGKGVCASYAYFTNILLNKAGINSFEISSNNHGWNLVELDDKYYYIDTTNMDDSVFYNFLLKTLNITEYYMIDTENTFSTSMKKPADDQVIIPLSLIKDIQAGRDAKDLFEKYGGQVGNIGVALGWILYSLACFCGFFTLAMFKDESKEYYDNVRYHYLKLIDKNQKPKL